MKRIVVDKNQDIFDYVVDYAIKQHNHPEEFRKSCPELSNIASRHYYIKFCGANGRAYRCFKKKFSCEPEKGYNATILRWRKGDDEIGMSVSWYGWRKYDYTSRKQKHLFVNYIVVNGKQVFKCRPCWSSNRERDEVCNWSWRYWFEY